MQAVEHQHLRVDLLFRIFYLKTMQSLFEAVVIECLWHSVYTNHRHTNSQ